MVATILLVFILSALAATAYFPGNEGATYGPRRCRIDRRRRADRFRNPNKPDTALRHRRSETPARVDTAPPPIARGR